MPDWVRYATEIATVVLIPLLIANIRVLTGIRDLVREHHQTLYGVKGENGLVGVSKLLRARSHEHMNVLQRHEFEIEKHEKDITGLKEWRLAGGGTE